MPYCLYLLPIGSVDNGVVRMVLDSGSFAKAILLLLLCFSIVAWAVIFHKFRAFGRVEKANSRFLRLFRSGESIRDIHDVCVAIKDSPLSGMLRDGWQELGNLEPLHGSEENIGILRQNISTSLEARSTNEISHLRRYLVFLAVTSSVCPFFGLLGTVWGVMDSFIAIGVYGSANIQVVAPGIAEALITTVAGLAAAIPAVIAYNYFVSRLRRIIEVTENFTIEFTNTVVREVL